MRMLYQVPEKFNIFFDICIDKCDICVIYEGVDEDKNGRSSFM